MTRVYWDSMMLIYLLENHPTYATRVDYLLNQILARGHVICTSVFTVGEVLVGAYIRGAQKEAERVRALLRAPLVDLLPFTTETANHFARIRAKHRVAAADAIHLATAAEAGVQLFLSNDKDVARLTVDGIAFIAGIDINVY